MTIQELKQSIESKSISSEGLIFVSDNSFIPTQYIAEISKISGKCIKYVDDLNQVVKHKTALFGAVLSQDILVFVSDSELDIVDVQDWCYVITKKYKGDNGVVVPKIENWHLLDYVKTNSATSIPDKYIRDLVKACKGDPHLVINEFDKFALFPDVQQLDVFKNLLDSGQLVRSYDETIFDFTNALLDKDLSQICMFYKNLSNYDIEPLGVVSIIYQQVKKIILVGFNKNPTEENTGLSSKQIYWIKKNLNKYKSSYILDKFTFICEAEKALKEGRITNNQLLDYVVVNLLT